MTKKEKTELKKELEEMLVILRRMAGRKNRPQNIAVEIEDVETMLSLL